MTADHLNQGQNIYTAFQMLVDMTSSMSSSCCGGNVTRPGCCGTDQDKDGVPGDEAVTPRRLTSSCCRVTSRLRLGWVTTEDEGLYTCSPAGLASLGLEDRVYIHVIQSPVVEERWGGVFNNSRHAKRFAACVSDMRHKIRDAKFQNLIHFRMFSRLPSTLIRNKGSPLSQSLTNLHSATIFATWILFSKV